MVSCPTPITGTHKVIYLNKCCHLNPNKLNIQRNITRTVWAGNWGAKATWFRSRPTGISRITQSSICRMHVGKTKCGDCLLLNWRHVSLYQCIEIKLFLYNKVISDALVPIWHAGSDQKGWLAMQQNRGSSHGMNLEGNAKLTNAIGNYVKPLKNETARVPNKCLYPYTLT